jgi:hypothetical protein
MASTEYNLGKGVETGAVVAVHLKKHADGKITEDSVHVIKKRCRCAVEMQTFSPHQ